MKYLPEAEVEKYVEELFKKNVLDNPKLYNRMEGIADALDVGIEINVFHYDDDLEHEIEIHDFYVELENFDQVLELEGLFAVKFNWFKSGYSNLDRGVECFDGTWIPEKPMRIHQFVEYTWGKVSEFVGENDEIFKRAGYHSDYNSTDLSWDDKRLETVTFEDLVATCDEEELYFHLNNVLNDAEVNFSIYPEKFRPDIERIYRKYKDQESQDS